MCFTYRCWPWKLMPIIFNPNQWKQTNALPTLATLAQQMRMKWGYFAIQSKSLRLEFNSTAIANTFMIVPPSLSNMSNQLNGYWLFPITSIVPEGSSSLNEDHNFPSYPLTSWFTWEVLTLRAGSDRIPVPDPSQTFFQVPDPSRPENWKWLGTG